MFAKRATNSDTDSKTHAAHDTPLKCVLLGDETTGKSRLCTRFAKNYFFEHSESTVGAAFLTHTVAQTEQYPATKLELWDTGGNQRYRSLLPMYIRNANIVLVTVDLSAAKVNKWQTAAALTALAKHHGPNNALIYIVGTKSDLLESDQKTLTEQTATLEKFTHDNNCAGHFICSAKTGEGVQNIFQTAVAQYHQTQVATASQSASSHRKKAQKQTAPAANAREALIKFIAQYNAIKLAECTGCFSWLFSCFRRYGWGDEWLAKDTTQLGDAEAGRYITDICAHAKKGGRFFGFFENRSATAIRQAFNYDGDLGKETAETLKSKIIALQRG